MQNEVVQESYFDLRYYLNLLLRRSWIIGICFLVIAGLAFFVSKQLTPIYQATTTIMVNLPSSTRSANYDTVVMNERLALTYSQMITSREVLEKVAPKLGVNLTPEELRKILTVTPIKNTQLISVIAEHTIPELAAGIANTTVDVFTSQIASNQTSQTSSVAKDLQNQIQQVEDKISSLRTEMEQQAQSDRSSNLQALDTIIKGLQDQVTQTQVEVVQLQYNYPSMKAFDVSGRQIIVTATPNLDQRKQLATRQQDLDNLKSLIDKYQSQYVNLSVAGQNSVAQNSSLEQIQSVISLYQGIYTTLMQNYETVRLTEGQSAGNVTQIDKATIPIKPVRPNISLFTLVGAFLGIALSTGGIIFVDAMDDSIKNPDIITERFKLPILSTIYKIQGKNKLLTIDDSLHTPTAESFRILRTNLIHARENNPPQVILVTSPRPSDGKTTISTNLATVFSQSGLRVTLIDGDMRKPRLHQMVGTLNDVGLSDLILHPDQDTLEKTIMPMNGFSLIGAGPIPDNPSELLDSGQMRIIIEKLLKRTDIIIIDSPPVLSVPDPLILSTYVDGVVLVLKPDTINVHILNQTIQQLQRVDANILGIVINDVHPNPRNAYYHSYYAYEAYHKQSANNEDGNLKDRSSYPFLKPQKRGWIESLKSILIKD